ncbi:hypothetical protein Pint_19765 [Pistacia integerrima]|uniref:Uncharacterized protein n=1 Tax=Pistacia integerrima TaxID=434235 RepID=A0ACC0XD12_9ROSI|nr:hypothetical protein Pint_19765 [Pistacia integerrima]
MPRPGDGAPRPVTLIPGDGIGPLVTEAVEQVMDAMQVYFGKYEVHGDMNRVPEHVMESYKEKQGRIGGVRGTRARVLRDLLYCLPSGVAGPVPFSWPYSIILVLGTTVSEFWRLPRVITKFCSERIAKYAFEYAYLNNRKKVTAVHKANIMKLADGLFLESCREVATKYPSIKYNEVTPNLYGNLGANTAAGIAGGTGVMPGGNVGADHAVFEQGASAGNVGNEKVLEQKKANPVALLLSSAMMLRHLQFPSFADRLETAVKRVISAGKCMTKDLGGHSTTQEVINAVISNLE